MSSGALDQNLMEKEASKEITMIRYFMIFLFAVISSAAISHEAVTHIAVSGVLHRVRRVLLQDSNFYLLEESACEPAAFAVKYRS